MSTYEPKRPAADNAAELPGFSLPLRPAAEQGTQPLPQPPTPQEAPQPNTPLQASLEVVSPAEMPVTAVPAAEEPDYSSDEWEYKPSVKYAAAGLLAAAAIGLLGSVYWLGHRQGYAACVESDLVSERLNAAAASNLMRFMQLTAADDAELQTLAADPDKELAWVKDPAIRREAEWQLVSVLMNRGMLSSAESLLNGLFAAERPGAQWASRAVEVGDAFFAARNPQEAAAWYDRAAQSFAALGRPAEHVAALQQYFAALCATAQGGSTKALNDLEQLVATGEEARQLRTAVRLRLALMYHARGQMGEAADALLRITDELLPGGKPAAALTPAEQIIAGIALAEEGQNEAALPLLTKGEDALGHELSDAPCRLEALRRTASVTMQLTGDVNGALALLNRAEGVAECVLPPEHDFWACLAEQRGWLLLLAQDEDAALESFLRAVETPRDIAVAMQAMEGAGRCQLALNKAQDAEKMLTRCAELRRKQAESDKAGLGRVTLLLAQAQDHQGQTEAAAANYAAAAALLEQAGEAESANYLTALLGRGYALVQLKQWEDGLSVWEKIQPLVKEQPDRREEARKLLNECRRHNHLPSAAVPHDPQATAEAAAADAAAEAEAEDPDEEAAAQ